MWFNTNLVLAAIKTKTFPFIEYQQSMKEEERQINSAIQDKEIGLVLSDAPSETNDN